MHTRDVEIPEPCHADWDAMLPRARGRFCTSCKKKVHDLSAMTEGQARTILRRVDAGEDVCISYLADDEGAIAFAPAPVVPLARLRRLLPAAGLAVAAAACTPTEPASPVPAAPTPVVVVDAEPSPPEPAAESPSLLAHPMQAVSPPARDDEGVEDIPCDGSMSDPTQAVEPEPVPIPTTPITKPLRRTAGVPMRTPLTRSKGGVGRGPVGGGSR